MRVRAKVHEVIERSCGHLHGARFRAVADAVAALVVCGRVVGASLGRAIAVGTSDKHGIKRIDRLLGNPKLQSDLLGIYQRLAAHVVGSLRQPIVLVDWSNLGKDKCMLKAVVALHGRGLPLYAECHRLEALGRPGVHRTFLARLRKILPPGCTPVIVTDAGFKYPWMQEVRALGWDFITRVRGRTAVRPVPDAEWSEAKRLLPPARRRLWDMPLAQINKCGPRPCRLVRWDGRSRRARRKPAEGGRRMRVRRAVRSAFEPWLLATSLQSAPKAVVAAYALRMQVEESLRDDKTLAGGWALNRIGTRSCARVNVQILLVALATIATLLAGIAAEQAGLSRHYQANTERRRRVLSLVFLGRRVLETTDLSRRQLLDALAWLHSHTPQLGRLDALE